MLNHQMIMASQINKPDTNKSLIMQISKLPFSIHNLWPISGPHIRYHNEPKAKREYQYRYEYDTDDIHDDFTNAC